VLLYTKNFTKTYTTPHIKTVSTIGAGDSFNAGIIYGLQKLNITKQELPDLPEEKWDKLIEYAIRFATDVCRHYENYISKELAALLYHSE
jgi:fructokinase